MTEHANARRSLWPSLTEEIPEISAFVLRMTQELRKNTATITNYEADVKRFASFIGSREKLLAATTDDLFRFIAMLISDRSYKTATIRAKIASLRSFYAFLTKEGIRLDNPVLNIPPPKVGQRLPKVLTENEVSRIIDARKPGRDEELMLRNRAMLEILYASGIRRSELINLDVDQVDLDHMTMRVIGKGNKERTVLLNKTARNAIRAYLRVRPRTGNPALFLSQRKKRLSQTQTWEIFHEAWVLSGVKKKASPHTMRHSFATHLVENDVDIVSIKKMLGHQSLSTTQIYTDVSMKHMRKSYDASHPRDRQAS